MQRILAEWGLAAMSYEPRKYRNPVLEEIERNFGFDDSLLELDRAARPTDEDQSNNERS